MNVIALTSPALLTMSSREIAELVDLRHDNVKRTIETLSEKGVITLPQFEEVSNAGPGPKTIKVYNLGKRDSLIVVAQLCPEFTAKIVDRWQELEDQVAKPAALNPANLSRLQLIEIAMQAEQERMALEQKVDVLAPKAEALDRLATADGSFCLRDAAKNLQVRPLDLKRFLLAQRWIYTRPGVSEPLAYEDRRQNGFLEHKVTPYQRTDGTEGVKTQVRVTGKGLAKLAQLLKDPPMHAA